MYKIFTQIADFSVKTPNNNLHHLFMRYVLNCQVLLIIYPYTLYIGYGCSYLGRIIRVITHPICVPVWSVIYSKPLMFRTTSISSPHLGHFTLYAVSNKSVMLHPNISAISSSLSNVNVLRENCWLRDIGVMPSLSANSICVIPLSFRSSFIFSLVFAISSDNYVMWLQRYTIFLR